MTELEKKIVEDPLIEKVLLRRDLAYFSKKILNMEIVNHHKEWSELCATNNKIAIEAARDSGKSFFWCFAYCIWRMYHNWMPTLPPEFKSIPRISLGYVFSNTQQQAIDHLHLIKEEVENNERLRWLKPSHAEMWSKQEIKCSNGSILRARGWNGGVRGAHPCYIVCDDTLSEENLYSELTRRKEKDYLFSAVTPMLIPGGQQVVVGTPFHGDDLYADLENNLEYIFRKYPAINGKGEALWPTRYPLEALEKKRREIGSTRFAREYLVIPIAEDSSLFPERIVKECFDEQYEMPIHLTEEDKQGTRLYTGVDLALSSSVGADYTVITTLAVDAWKRSWIVDIRRKKGLSMTEQFREIEDVYRSYRPLKIAIENNQFQKVFQDELVRRTDLPIVGHTTTFKKNTLEQGVPTLQILFENKKIVVARKTERDRRITDILVHELRCFSWIDGKLQGVGAHDDCLRKGALIQTVDGLVPIELIKVGDRVLTHNGNWKRVTNFIKKPYKGKCYKISPFGSGSIEVTKEHPLYVACKMGIDPDRDREYGFFKPRWMTPSQVVKGKHRTMFPVNREVNEFRIDLLDFFVGSDKAVVEDGGAICFKNYGDKKVQRFLEIDELFCRFIGLYLAEGHCRKNGQASLCVNKLETDILKEAGSFLDKIGVLSRIEHRGECCVLHWSNRFLGDFLYSLGKHDVKKLPSEFLFLRPDLQMHIVDWWLKGDGWNSIGATTSIQLANQMYIFLLRNNVVSNIRRCERKRYEKKTKPQWWIEITGRDERHLGKSNIVGDYRYSAIKAYEFFDIEEDVYNIEVEDDESYVVNHTIVHNCVMSLWIAKECASSDSFNFGFIGAE